MKKKPKKLEKRKLSTLNNSIVYVYDLKCKPCMMISPIINTISSIGSFDVKKFTIQEFITYYGEGIVEQTPCLIINSKFYQGNILSPILQCLMEGVDLSKIKSQNPSEFLLDLFSENLKIELTNKS